MAIVIFSLNSRNQIFLLHFFILVICCHLVTITEQSFILQMLIVHGGCGMWEHRMSERLEEEGFRENCLGLVMSIKAQKQKPQTK